MPLTTHGANLVATWLWTAGAATRPTQWWLGVGTGANAAGLTGEPSGNGYARQQITQTVTGGAGTTGVDETFGPVTGSAWGNITHGAIFDASTGGNCLATGELSAAKQMDVGDTLTFPAGDIDTTVT